MQQIDYQNLVLSYEIDGAFSDLPSEMIVEKIQSGQDELLPALWNKVRRLVISRAVLYWKVGLSVRGSTSFEVEDLIQAGFLAVTKAAKTYRPNSEARFTSYLCNFFLKTAFSEVCGIRTSKRDCLQYSGSLNIEIGEDGTEELTDLIPDPEQDVEVRVLDELFNRELHEKLEECLINLRPEQETILRRRFYDGQTLNEIADELEISGEAVRQREQAALNELYENRFINGLDQYLDSRTSFYPSMKDDGYREINSVEKLVLRRQMLAEKWIQAHTKRKIKHV